MQKNIKIMLLVLDKILETIGLNISVNKWLTLKQNKNATITFSSAFPGGRFSLYDELGAHAA